MGSNVHFPEKDVRLMEARMGRRPVDFDRREDAIARTSLKVAINDNKPQTARDRLYAKGRLPEGQMNSTEQRYADHLRMQMLVGEVLWWQFEGVNLRLAKGTHLRIDFPQMRADGQLWMVDTKGADAAIQDKWWAKAKVAAAMYPFHFATAIERKDRSGWDVEEIVP